MFCRIFLCVIINFITTEAVLLASSDNGLLNTVTLENNNTSTKHPINANVVRKWLERLNFVEGPTPTNFHHVSQSNDEEDDRTSNVFFRSVGKDQQTVVLKEILSRWVSLMKNKSKEQVPVLKAYNLYTESAMVLPRLAFPKTLREGFVDKLSTNQIQVPNKPDNDMLTPEHFVPRPWWMQSKIEFSSTAIVNVTTQPQQSMLIKKGNEKQTIALNKFASNLDNNQLKTGSEERKLLRPIHLIPEPRVIGDMDVPNSERENQQLSTTTENELIRETDFIHPLTQRTINKAVKVNPTTANPSTAQEPEQVDTHSTTATQDTKKNHFNNWALLLIDSKTNKLFEEEHDQLENEHQNKKKQQETTSQTHLESVEVDDDRNKALRHKVETWYGNLQSRRASANLRVSPELGNIKRFRRDLQAALAAVSQKRQLSEWQRFHAVDYRRLRRWRRQLHNQYSMPQAVDYRRLLSLWRKELRRQLQIKWNRRPLVEISPGAFKTDIYVNPPDDLAKHMQKLLALKKKQEEKNRDLNAGKEEAE